MIKQIPLEHIEERDRRLVIAPGIEQVHISLYFGPLYFITLFDRVSLFLSTVPCYFVPHSQVLSILQVPAGYVDDLL